MCLLEGWNAWARLLCSWLELYVLGRLLEKISAKLSELGPHMTLSDPSCSWSDAGNSPHEDVTWRRQARSGCLPYQVHPSPSRWQQVVHLPNLWLHTLSVWLHREHNSLSLYKGVSGKVRYDGNSGSRYRTIITSYPSSLSSLTWCNITSLTYTLSNFLVVKFSSSIQDSFGLLVELVRWSATPTLQ